MLAAVLQERLQALYIAVASALVGDEVVADVYWSIPGERIRSYLSTVWHIYHMNPSGVQPLYSAYFGKFGTLMADVTFGGMP